MRIRSLIEVRGLSLRPSARPAALALLLLLGLSGCSADPGSDAADAEVITDPNHPSVDPYADEETGAVARYEVAAEGNGDWHSSPFPTNLRRDASSGKLDLSGFPQPLKGKPDDLLAAYLALGETDLDGFSIQPTVYVQFDKAIRSALLPTVAESLTDASGAFLINIDAASPGYGERVPLRWKLSGDTPGNLLAPHMLMMQPTWGTPLRPATTYAFVLDRKLRDVDDKVLARPAALAAAIDGLTGAEALSTDAGVLRLADTLAPLWAAMQDGKVPVHPKAVAAATVFTTGNPTAQLATTAAWVRKNVTRKSAKSWKKSGQKFDGYRVYRGVYESPNFQQGEPPYLEKGGGFEFTPTGEPKVQRTEELRVSVSVPDDHVHAVGGLLPVVIYSHGTGGHYESYRNGGKLAPAQLLTNMGLVVIGIDQPMHGPRTKTQLSTNALYLASFNFFNPPAGRTTFRQAALDNVHLIEMLRDGKLDIPGSVTHDGKPVRLDPNRMLFMGHSQGGIVGPLLASVEPNFRAFVLSGAGAGLSLTAVSRKDIVNFPNLIKARLGLLDGEISEFHPAISLIQMLVDVTDTLAYARHVFERAPDKRPPHLLMTEGLLDEATPSATAEALAAAMGLHLLKPAAHLNEAMEVLDTLILQPPVNNNLVFGKHQVTGVLSQYPKGDHYVIFDDKRAAHLARDFLFSVATTGEAIVE